MKDREETRIIYRGFGFGHILLAVLGVADAGAAAAYLTAPRSGEETRRRLRRRAEDARVAANRVPHALREASGAALEAFEGALSDKRA